MGGLTERVLWAVLYGYGAYALGDQVHRLTGIVGKALAVLAVLAIIAALVFLKRNEQRLEEEAEAAMPGPLDQYQPRKRRPRAA